MSSREYPGKEMKQEREELIDKRSYRQYNLFLDFTQLLLGTAGVVLVVVSLLSPTEDTILGRCS